MGWIIAAFIAGEMIGLITAAVVFGWMEKLTEWRKRKHEKKDIHYRF